MAYLGAGNRVVQVDGSGNEIIEQPGISPVQTSPAVPAFVNGDTTGASGSNGTVTQVVAANANRTYLKIINNGSGNVELWYNAKPADANVGQTVPKGDVYPAGGGIEFTARVPLSAIYATTSVAGGLSVIEG